MEPSLHDGWKPIVEFVHENDMTIAIVKAWRYKCQDCKSDEIRFVRRNQVKRGIARRHQNDAMNKRFGEKLALYRAIGQDFQVNWKCNDCNRIIQNYSDAKQCARLKHNLIREWHAN